MVSNRLRNAASIMLSDARSLMAVPIVVQRRVLGLIQLESSHLGRPFDERAWKHWLDSDD